MVNDVKFFYVEFFVCNFMIMISLVNFKFKLCKP